MLRRLILGVGAHAFGQIVTVSIQLLSLPVFLIYWDAATYGTWIVLSVIPAYLSMADLGMTSVAGNMMTMAMGRGEVDAANRVFQSAQVFVGLVCATVSVVVTPAVLLWPMPDTVTVDMRVALLALMADVLISLYGGLSNAVFKATDRYAFGAALEQVCRLVQWAGFILGLMIFRSFSGVAVLGCLTRAFTTLIVVWLGQREGRGLRLGVTHAGAEDLTAMVRPAMSFMAFALTNALNFQGITLLVGFLAGASAVAVFNTYRTLVRVAVQFTAMFSLPLWPEFARLYGHRAFGRLGLIFRQSLVISCAVSAAFSVVLYLAAPLILHRWTHDRIVVSPSLLMTLLAYAAVASAWHVPRVLLMATNQHAGLSRWSIVAVATALASGYFFGRMWGTDGVALSMLLSETFMATICIRLALDLLPHDGKAVWSRP